jgi:hypothetical protein
MDSNKVFVLGLLSGAWLALAGCSNGTSSNAKPGPAVCPNPGGAGLRPFVPPDKSKLAAGQLLLTASGESLAQQGYNFPDMVSNGVFSDGWEVRFKHFIATFDQVTISNNPDKVKTDQSQTDEAVAIACGPWVVDLSIPTANDVPGKEQGEMATPFAVIATQNLFSDSPPFKTDGTKYAVGFSAVVASPNAINVNLDAEGVAFYSDMVTKGCAVLYVGTATFKADPSQCTTQGSEFSSFPPVVNFSLCFKSPTQYINCDNQDVMGNPFGSEPHPRGIVFPTNTYVTGEVTFHTDHPFWESVVHDTPAHFDQFAARVATPDGGTTDGGAADVSVPLVTMENLKGADYLAYTDPFGNPVQWRSCVKDNMGNQYGKSSGRMAFDSQSVPHAPPGPVPTTAGLRDYYDFSTYNQSTQGHWNGVDGLCFVKRNFPAPN